MNRPRPLPAALLAAAALNCSSPQDIKSDPFQAGLEERVIDYRKPQSGSETTPGPELKFNLELTLPNQTEVEPQDIDNLNRATDKCAEMHRDKLAALVVAKDGDQAKALMQDCVEREMGLVAPSAEPIDPAVAQLNEAIKAHLVATRTNCDQFLKYHVDLGSSSVEKPRATIKVPDYEIVAGEKAEIRDKDGVQVNVTLFNQVKDGKPIAGFSVGELCASKELVANVEIEPDTRLDVSEALQAKVIYSEAEMAKILE